VFERLNKQDTRLPSYIGWTPSQGSNSYNDILSLFSTDFMLEFANNSILGIFTCKTVLLFNIFLWKKSFDFCHKKCYNLQS